MLGDLMKLGLALSGGGIKGAAHIGVLKALEEQNIKIEYIAGTSSGSIVASLYACGYHTEEIYKLFKKYCKEINYIEFGTIFKIIKDLIIKRKLEIEGLNSGKNLEKIIKKACDSKNIYNINQIKFNLVIPAVDLNNGNVIYFCSKNVNKEKNYRHISDEEKYIYNAEISKAVRSSCSYPGVFVPEKFRNTKLIDGGIRENTPWKKIKEFGADKVLSVIFEDYDKIEKKDKNVIEIVMSSIEIMGHELENYELNGADFLLKIKTPKISLLDISKIDFLYNLGYEETKKQLQKINLKSF